MSKRKMTKRKVNESSNVLDVLRDYIPETVIQIIEAYRYPQMLIEMRKLSVFVYCNSIANLAHTKEENIDTEKIVGVYIRNGKLQFCDCRDTLFVRSKLYNPSERMFLSPMDSRNVYIGSNRNIQFMDRYCIMHMVCALSSCCETRYAVTEMDLIGCVRDKIARRVKIKIFNNTKNSWGSEARYYYKDSNDTYIGCLFGLCGNADWFVVTHAYGVLVYNRKTESWHILKERHCYCISLHVPIVWDNILYLFGYNKRRLHTIKYDLLTLYCIEYHQCNIEEGILARKDIKYIIIY